MVKFIASSKYMRLCESVRSKQLARILSISGSACKVHRLTAFMGKAFEGTFSEFGNQQPYVVRQVQSD